MSAGVQYTCFNAMVTESEATHNRLEGRFQAVFEAAAMGAALSDMDGRLIETNAALQRMLGYSADDLRGMSFVEFTHPEDAVRQHALFTELVAGLRDSYQIEKRYVRKD